MSIKTIFKRINVEPFMRLLLKKRLLFILIALIVSISLFAGYVYYVNYTYNKNEIFTEITYLSPTEALVFWKTEEESVGYVKIGQEKFSRTKTITQTSSEPSIIHVVYIDKIKPEGLYLSKHTDKQPLFLIPKIHHLKYKE